MIHGGRFDSPDERDAWEERELKRIEERKRDAWEERELKREREEDSERERIAEEYERYMTAVAPQLKRTPEYIKPERAAETTPAESGLPPSRRQIGGRHYAELAVQPGEFIHRNGLGWCEGNAVKYITRHRLKGQREDVEKAIHYLELLLEWDYPQ
jgi:hypothetical protein